MTLRDYLPTALVALVAGILIAIVLWGAGGCNHYATAWRATAAVKAAGNLADDSIASSVTAKHRECIAKHCGSDDPAKCKSPAEYRDCVGKAQAVGLAWMQVVRPAINSALQATVTGLTIAERVKLKPDFNWMDALKPAVCMLSKVAKEWSDYFGPNAQTVKTYLAVVEGVACD